MWFVCVHCSPKKETRMAAPKHDSSRERQLRRTVTELNEHSIDDIETIWSALSHEEREQLHPLLAEAARVAPGNLTAASIAGAIEIQSGSVAGNGTGTGPEFTQRIARLGESLPNELLSRLVFSLDDRVRDAIVEALPPERRALLVRDAHASRITEHARLALRSAAFAASAQSFEPLNIRSETLSVKRRTLCGRLRRWIGRSA
jgi:hypothetical protein